MVVVLASRAQVRDIERLHDADGVTQGTHHVQAGHHVVRQLATSGTPVSPRRSPDPSRSYRGHR
jgi:hypothetical protein